MHSGFGPLRQHCPQNLEAQLPEVGARVWTEQAGVQRNVARLQAMWADALQASGGPFLFGAFSAVDAYFAPVVMRLKTYALPVNDTTAAYMARVQAAPGVAAFIEQALAEQDYLDFEEPYRTHR
jgi:glutathione S-transferase